MGKWCMRLALAAAALVLAVPANADGRLVLKASQAFNFTKNAVTKPGDPAADIIFNSDPMSRGASILGAKKIRDFGTAYPDVGALKDVRSWPTSASPTPPHNYVVQGHDGKTLYLVQVTALNSIGKTAEWELDVFWEKLW